MMENISPPAGSRTTPPPTTRQPGRSLLVAVLPGCLLLALALVAVIAAGGLAIYSSPRIFPGVQVMGVPVGGLEREQAAQAVAAAWERQTITVETGGQPVTFLATELGFTLDTDQTIQAAHALGRRPDNLTQVIPVLLSGINMPPQWHFAPATAESRLAVLAEQLDTRAVNAGVVIRQGRAEAVPAIPGRIVDVPATLALLAAQPAEILATGRLALVTRPAAPAFSDPASLVAELNAHLAHPLTLHAFDPIRQETFDWVAPPERWGEWITISAPEADPTALQWQVDPQQARYFVETAAGDIGTERTLDIALATAALLDSIPAGTYRADMRLYHQDRTHTVQPGETLSSIAFDYGLPYPWIQEANPQLNGTLSAGQSIVIPSPDVMLPLPVVAEKRIVVRLSTQEMWAYAGEEILWHWPVSTGIDSSPTAPGVFQIQSHEENAYAGNWDLWMPHFMGIYRPVPTIPFMNGFHGFPTRNGSTLLWTGDLGRPVTYGCILISSENAATLYDWAEPGVVVEIRP